MAHDIGRNPLHKGFQTQNTTLNMWDENISEVEIKITDETALAS